MPRRFGLLSLLLLPFALLFSVASRGALPIAVDGEPLPSLAPMVEQVSPAVVNVATEGRIQSSMNPLLADPFFRRFFNVPNQPMERRTQSLGSGVIVDAGRGLILTNNHVIANADQIEVGLLDGRHLKAELVGTDPETDIAVIKVPPQNLTEVKTADSSETRVGDFVVAIGNPFGLGHSVSSGIVSALSRSGLGIEGYEDFIQIDAPINPGNSGGALVNLRGELIGINTAIISPGGGSIGIGFAIPVGLALQVMEQLLKSGRVERGFVGVAAQDLTPELAEAFGLKAQKGAVVNSVQPDSPAETAGLLAGDVIVGLNSKPVNTAADVRNHIGLLKVGDKVEFDVLRDGKRKTLSASVKARAGSDGGEPAAINPRLEGVSVGDLEPGHPLHGRVEGVVVAAVEPGSYAWRSGLRPGDVIASVNRVKVRNLQDFLKQVDRKESSLVLQIIRGDAAAFLVIK
jgi:serine protease Do/serine protease DegQ